jgi:ferritin-like metal-binding protein YciE
VASEVNARDGKLIQWLNEAYGKEKQLETALAVHIQMAEPATYKKRLQQHLKETKGHARELERRIKKLGGKAEAVDLPGPDVVGDGITAVANVAGRAVAQAQGAVQAVRGTSDAEKRLKNAKDELHEEAEEIANYTAIIALAENVQDKDTVKMAKSILREEQRMYDFVEKQIPRLTKEVVKAEIPANERKQGSSSRSRSSSSRSSSSRSSGGSSRSRSGSSSRSSSSRSSSSSRGSSSRSRSGGSSRSSNSSSGGARSTARKAASSGRKAASTAGKTARTAAKSGSTAARKTGKSASSNARTAAKRTASTARKSASGSSSKASGRSSNGSSGSSSSRSSGSRSSSTSSRKKS